MYSKPPSAMQYMAMLSDKSGLLAPVAPSGSNTAKAAAIGMGTAVMATADARHKAFSVGDAKALDHAAQ